MHRGLWPSTAVLSGLCLCFLLPFALPRENRIARQPNAAEETLAGGLLETPPLQSLGENQVKDSTFEKGGAGWTLGPCWSVDASAAHQGQHSLRFDADGRCQARPAQTRINRGPTAARSYTLRAWVRTSKGSDLRVRVGLHNIKDRDFVVGETEFVSPTDTWQEVVRKDIDLLPVHDGNSLAVRAVVQGSTGTAWFDDVELVEQSPLPLSVFLLYPNYHGYLWSNGPQKIRFRVDVGVPNPSATWIRATLRREHGETIKSVEEAAGARQEFSFDGSTLALGPYWLEVGLVDRQGGRKLADYPAYRITKVSEDFQKQLVNYISPDNFLVHLGKKRFVWGAYDRFSARFRCRDCVFTNEERYLQIPGLDGKTTLANYAETKINAEINILPFAGVRVDPFRDQLTPWLAALHSKGVGHLQIVNNWIEGIRARPLWAQGLSDTELWKRLTNTMKGKPGGLGYYTYDEPRADRIPAIFQQYQTLRELDPGSVDFGVLVNASQIFRWRDVSDVLGCDPYPVNNFVNSDAVAYGATSPPAMVLTSAWTHAAVTQVYGSRPIWMVLQLFRMGKFFPSYNEMKMQAYKAIINGATGIVWWGFVSEKGLEAEWNKEYDHASYANFQRISEEVMALEPALIAPSRPDLLTAVSNRQIETLIKAQGNRIIIFASNFLPEEDREVRFTLSGGTRAFQAAARIKVHGENRGVALNRRATFTDSFGPYEAHVYILDATTVD